MDVTTDNLNSVMEFDHVIRVHDDGTVSEPKDIYAPEAHEFLESGGAGTVNGWSLMNGWSGQYGYSGPWMHASEYVGGAMARWILENPGVYVAIVDFEGDSWAVAYRD